MESPEANRRIARMLSQVKVMVLGNGRLARASYDTAPSFGLRAVNGQADDSGTA